MENWVERILSDNIGNKSLYEMINDIGFRVVNFAMLGQLIIRNKFPCSKIYLK
jgi:hypothetical protein